MNNTQIEHISLDYKQGSKSGTVVFIHGNSSSKRSFDHYFIKSKNTYNLLRLDLPGHGNSYRSDDIKIYSFQNYRKLLTNLLNTIDDEILLVGHSMGGHLAIEISPEVSYLKGLVIYGTPPLKKPVNLAEAFNPVPELQHMFQEEVSEETAKAMFMKVCVNHESLDLVLSDFYQADPRVRSALANDIAEGDFYDEAEIFKTLKTRKFIIHPLGDPTLNMDYIQSLTNDISIIKIQDCGHYPSIERPEEFGKTIDEISGVVFRK